MICDDFADVFADVFKTPEKLTNALSQLPLCVLTVEIPLTCTLKKSYL